MNELDLGCREISVCDEADRWAGGCDALIKVYPECHMATRSQEESEVDSSQESKGSCFSVSLIEVFLKMSEWQDLIYGFQRDWYLL